MCQVTLQTVLRHCYLPYLIWAGKKTLFYLASDQYLDNIFVTNNILREAGQFDLAPDQYSLHSRPASQTGSYRYLLTAH